MKQGHSISNNRKPVGQETKPDNSAFKPVHSKAKHQTHQQTAWDLARSELPWTPFIPTTNHSKQTLLLFQDPKKIHSIDGLMNQRAHKDRQSTSNRVKYVTRFAPDHSTSISNTELHLWQVKDQVINRKLQLGWWGFEPHSYTNLHYFTQVFQVWLRTIKDTICKRG